MGIQDESAVSQYNKPVLVGVGLSLTLLAIFVVGLRFCARRKSRANYGWDDWSILLALVLCIAGGIVEILAAEIGGMGEHQRLGPNGELIHTPELYNYEKCRYANEIITTLNLGVVKVSVVLFYRRIFTIRPFKIASATVMGIVIAWTLSYTVVMAAQCIPTHIFWDDFEIDYGTRCINVQQMYESLAFSDLILDIMVLALPLPMVWMLNMPWKRKIALFDIFLLGTVVIGSGIARLISFMSVIHFTGRDPEGFFYDTLWYTAGPLFWLYAENAIAIIGACLPTLAPLWKREGSQRSKGSSYFSKLSNGNSIAGDHELHNRNNTGQDHTSLRNLVGVATDIQSDNAALEDQSMEGIKVETTFGHHENTI